MRSNSLVLENFSYGIGVALSVPLNGEVCTGKVLGVLGPNGAGKSTLLKALLNISGTRAMGKCLWENADCREKTTEERARIFTYLPQRPVSHFHFVASDVVRMGLFPWQRYLSIDTFRRRVDAEISIWNLRHCADRPLQALSGGEQQRVHLARTFVSPSPVIVLDEPDTHLDLATQVLLRERIRAETERAVILSTHDFSQAARLCHQVCLLKSGQPPVIGSAEEVLQPKRFRELYGIDAQWLIDPAGRRFFVVDA